jgi:DUF1016 N-terminal domain
MSSNNDLIPSDYQAWFTGLKTRIHTVQQRATLAVNRELITLYWELGKDILTRQTAQGWGGKSHRADSPGISVPLFRR